MAASRTTPVLDLAELMQSFEISLRAARRADSTVKAYQLGINQFIAWCEESGLPQCLDRKQVERWMASLNERGLKPATVASRLAAVRQLSKWLTEEEIIDSDPLLRLNAPKADIPITPMLTDDELRALIKACVGPTFRDRRDEAMVRLLAETGMRGGSDVLALDVDDIDLKRMQAYVRRGKGGKARIVPFGPQTAKALDRYIRMRRNHPAAALPALFLTARKRLALADHGMRRTLKERAADAGIAGRFHPHMLRHGFASRWLAAGGSEGGLMAVAGWSSRDMLDRYGRANAAERAAAEARGLNLGDI